MEEHYPHCDADLAHLYRNAKAAKALAASVGRAASSLVVKGAGCSPRRRRSEARPGTPPVEAASKVKAGSEDIGVRAGVVQEDANHDGTTPPRPPPLMPQAAPKEEAKESRIDFILANNRMTPAIVKYHVDENSDYPTHRPLCIEVLTRLLELTSRNSGGPPISPA